MTVIRHEPARGIYRCDACGKVGPWSDEWAAYSSLLLDEVCPESVPHVCSEACKVAATAKIESGEWKLPVLSRPRYGHHPRIKSGPLGYGPSAMDATMTTTNGRLPDDRSR